MVIPTIGGEDDGLGNDRVGMIQNVGILQDNFGSAWLFGSWMRGIKGSNQRAAATFGA
jgi:hypothetical protein